MKKLLSLLFTGILISSLFVGCGNKATTTSTASTLENIKKSGKIVIGLDDSYPPMEFRTDKNELVGFDIDVANEVAKKLGVKAEFQPTGWDGIFLALTTKKFDVIHSSVSITDDRKKTMLFSKPYVNGGVKVYVLAGSTKVKTVADLKGKVVGCQMGTTAQDALAKVDGLKEVKKYNGMTEAFMDLANGRLDAVAGDPMVGKYYLSKQEGKYMEIEEALEKEPIGVAFRKEDTSLLEAYDKAMDELKADGTLSKISVKWFGEDIYK